MQTTAADRPGTQLNASGRTSGTAATGIIHPIVIYPFRQPNDYLDLEQLYQLVARLCAERKKYAHPITVMDRKKLERASCECYEVTAGHFKRLGV